MLGSFATAILLSPTVGASEAVRPPNFEIDLILVSTPKPVSQFDLNAEWAIEIVTGAKTRFIVDQDVAKQLEPSRQAVRDSLAKNRPFFVFDGAGLKHSLYDARAPRFATYFGVRDYLKSDESALKKVYKKDMHVARAEASIPGKTYFDTISGFNIDENSVGIGGSKEFREVLPTFSIIDIASLTTGGGGMVSRSEYVQRAYTQLSLNFSPLSVSQTADAIKAMDPNYSRVCICAWGTPSKENDKLIATPPTGVAKVYRFGYSNGEWFARLSKVYGK